MAASDPLRHIWQIINGALQMTEIKISRFDSILGQLYSMEPLIIYESGTTLGLHGVLFHYDITVDLLWSSLVGYTDLT